MSELLDRIEKEIRERLAATRAAVLEHERLQAALHALTETGEDAARAVKGRVSRRREPPEAPPPAPPRPPAKPAVASRAPASRKPRTAAPARKPKPAARPRAPRGANREAVLKIAAERPGVTNAELSAASGVQRGTLSTLLRTLVERGELEKRPLPGGKVGYAVASSPAEPAPPTPEAEAATPPAPEPEAAPAPEHAADATPAAEPAADAPTAAAEASEPERSG